MSDLEARIGGTPTPPAEGWRLAWDDEARGLARLVNGEASVPIVVEGAGSRWWVTIAGRRIGVEVLTRRERLLAEAATAGRADAGPVVVKATLPGLVVAVAVAVGDEVEEGTPLLTVEAMKMQNEVRAPRAGRVIEVAASAGTPVATGAPLVRIE